MKEIFSVLLLSIGLGGGYFLGLAAALLLIPILVPSAFVYFVLNTSPANRLSQLSVDNITHLKNYDFLTTEEVVFQLSDEFAMLEKDRQRKPSWWVNT